MTQFVCLYVRYQNKEMNWMGSYQLFDINLIRFCDCLTFVCEILFLDEINN